MRTEFIVFSIFAPQLYVGVMMEKSFWLIGRLFLMIHNLTDHFKTQAAV